MRGDGGSRLGRLDNTHSQRAVQLSETLVLQIEFETRCTRQYVEEKTDLRYPSKRFECLRQTLRPEASEVVGEESSSFENGVSRRIT